MVNDRQITISVGNNRKSVNWQPQTLMLSEFYEKLRIPSRSTETMQEYLSLRKSEQDDKKDIGGFVAGTLSGPRRKAGAVTGREIITLDFDTIPPGGTEEILKRVDALGCGYCIYSTRKHSPASPGCVFCCPSTARSRQTNTSRWPGIWPSASALSSLTRPRSRPRG